MSSRIKKNVASVVTVVAEAPPTNEPVNPISQAMPEEKYVKKHPLNVNPTFNRRLSLL